MKCNRTWTWLSAQSWSPCVFVATRPLLAFNWFSSCDWLLMEGHTGHAKEKLNLTNGWLDKDLTVWRRKFILTFLYCFKEGIKVRFGWLIGRRFELLLQEMNTTNYCHRRVISLKRLRRSGRQDLSSVERRNMGSDGSRLSLLGYKHSISRCLIPLLGLCDLHLVIWWERSIFQRLTVTNTFCLWTSVRTMSN